MTIAAGLPPRGRGNRCAPDRFAVISLDKTPLGDVHNAARGGEIPGAQLDLVSDATMPVSSQKPDQPIDQQAALACWYLSGPTASGKTWGGSVKGRLLTVTPEQVATVKELDGAGVKRARIARTVGLSRPTIYRILSGA